MGLGKIFSAIGRGIKNPAVLSIAREVVPHLPVPGAAWAAILLRVAQAEREFPDSGTGKTHRRPWVEHQAAKDLRALGYDAEGLEALIELAVLNLKGLAPVRIHEDDREDVPEASEEAPEKETKKRPKRPKEAE